MSGGFITAAAAVHLNKKRKDNEPPSNEEEVDHVPEEVIEQQKMILLRHLTATVKQSTDFKVTFNTVGYICWIGIVPYTIFLYEAIVIAARNAHIPLSQPSTAALQEDFHFRLPYNARTASISSSSFTTASNFLLILFRRPILSLASARNVKIGAAVACTDLQTCNDKYLQTEMPLCFSTDATSFMSGLHEKSPLGQSLLELFLEMEDTTEYLTQCSIPISILLLNNYISKAVRTDTTSKGDGKPKKTSTSKAAAEEPQMQREDDYERILSQQLKNRSKARKSFQQVHPKKD